jgi:hypothetical protein
MRAKLLVASVLLATLVIASPAHAFRGGWGFHGPGFGFHHVGFRRDFDHDFDDRRFRFRRNFAFGHPFFNRPFFGRPFVSPASYAYTPYAYPYYYPRPPYYPGYYGY